MSQVTVEQALDLAVRHHQAGRLQQAEHIYRQILGQQPRHADALHLLGVIAHQTGRHDIAVDLIRQAIALGPGFAEAHSNLGNALVAGGQLDQAIAAYRQAIALDSHLAEVHSNLGKALCDQGKLDEAIIACRQAIALNPSFSQAHFNLANALKNKGCSDEAIAAFHQAIALNPSYPAAFSNLGIALRNQGQLDEAIAAFRQALALEPNSPETQNQLGGALSDQRQLDEAAAAFRQAIALKPGYSEAYNNLGVVLREKGQFDEAVAACRQAIQFNPDLPQAYNNLGSALRSQGQLDEAVAAYDRAIALKPLEPAAYSNRILALHYLPSAGATTIHQELRRWNELFAKPLKQFIRHHENSPDPQRRLRIGYVSPDFRSHVVGRNLLPLLREHDRTQFDIVCYASVSSPDEITAQIRQTAAEWRDILTMTDAKAADLIRADRIDILIDLSVHTAYNRLPIFAHKPAPLQLTWLGCVSSTGLDAVDYRFSDPYLDPPETDLSVYSESTFRLPKTYWCYGPLVESLDISPLPAKTAGFITFGSLNSPTKLSQPTLDLWAKILSALPRSRLLLHAHTGPQREQIASRLNLAPDRLEFLPHRQSAQYLQTFNRIDISLDPFPYNGGITTCDSLWMGVPIITLSGQTAVGRAGRSILSNIGLPELIAESPERYMQIARDLANDLPRLAELRATLRDRLTKSPLMDAKSFARDVEAAYRTMWTDWCRK